MQLNDFNALLAVSLVNDDKTYRTNNLYHIVDYIEYNISYISDLVLILVLLIKQLIISLIIVISDNDNSDDDMNND